MKGKGEKESQKKSSEYIDSTPPPPPKKRKIQLAEISNYKSLF